MKIMSFNTQHCLNFIEQKIDFEIMAKAILDVGADIVGLNEMRDAGDAEGYTAQVKKLAELCGMKYHYFAKAIDFEGNNPYGNGFISKYPIVKAETVPIPDPEPKTGDKYYETRCLARIELEGGITVIVTHFGLNTDEAENAVATVLSNITDKKCILMGDFNLTPDSGILKPIREKMKDTADIFTAPLMSFPSPDPNRKIDYIFTSHDIEITEADIPNIVASDHRPHTATLKL